MGSIPIGISASRAAAILGLSQYKTPVAAWLELMEQINPGFCEKNGYSIPKPANSAAIRFGHMFEDSIIDLAATARDMAIRDREKFFHRDFLTCHLDGIYSDGIIHEGKTTNLRAYRAQWGEPGTDRIPLAYQIQVQHQMLVSDIDKAIVSVLVFPVSADEMEAANPNPYTPIMAEALRDMGMFHQYPVEKNQAVQDALIEKYYHFYENHVKNPKPPEVASYDDLKLLIPLPSGEIDVPDRLCDLADEYGQIMRETDILKTRQDEIKTEFARYITAQDIKPDQPDKLTLYGAGGRKIATYNRNSRDYCVLRIPRGKEEI